MSDHAPAVFEATYADWRLIKTRKCVQIVLEIPIERADLAYQVLGGMPNNSVEAWLAVAKLDVKPRRETRFLEAPALASQIAMKCEEPKFQEFLAFHANEPVNSDNVARIIRECFGVGSRKDIKQEPWDKLVGEYRLWLRAAQ